MHWLAEESSIARRRFGIFIHLFPRLSSGPKRKISHSYTPLCDRNDGTIFESFRILGDDLEKITIDMLRAHVPKTKDDNTL